MSAPARGARGRRARGPVPQCNALNINGPPCCKAMAGNACSEGGAGENMPAGGLAAVYAHYQDKLLSITSRNRSVLLRKIHHKYGCDLAALERTTPGAATRAAPRAIKSALSGRPGRAEHAILSSSAGGDDADRIRSHLTYLARNLGRMEEETGQQAGYLGFPFLVGRAAPDLYVRGPVALFPASLAPGQGARAGGWAVQFHGRAPIVNSSLLMALKKRAQHPVPDDYEERFAAILEEIHDVEDSHEGYFLSKIVDWLQEFLPMDGAAGDPGPVEVAPLNSADLAAMGAEPLRLVNHKIVGSFPVADTKIYDDYAELIRRAGEPHHGLIAGLLGVTPGEHDLGGAAAGPLGEGGARADRRPSRAADIDGTPSATLNAVLPSDSSQDAVILESQRSDIVVVRGPPGTGKSQVIVNLVSDALMRGEKVLVVCQKRAALEVVRQRLDSAGLGRYSVFLEREADDRLLMYRHLCDIIEGEPAGDGIDGDIVGVARSIDAHVKYLRDFGDALHAKVNGATAYDLYSRADGSYAAALDLDGVEGLPDWGGLEGYLGRMGMVEADVKRFDDPAGPWHGRKSFDALTHRDKGSIKRDMRLIRKSSARSVLLGSREDQSRLAAALGSHASVERPGPSPSADIEKAILAGAGEGGGADAAAVFCAKLVADAAEAQACAPGERAEADREAGDALAEFAENYMLWDSAASLHRAAGDCMLVGGLAEQEALASALEAYVSRPEAAHPPSHAEIERAARIGMEAGGGGGGVATADAAAVFCAKMSDDLARASGLVCRAAPAPTEAVAAALSEFVGLCGSRARARALSRHAQGLLAGSLRDQEVLVAALKSYTGDSSIIKGRKKRAVREIAGTGLDPASVVGGSGENAAGSLKRAKAGLEFWRLLSAPPPPRGDPERFGPVIQAAARRSGVGPILAEAERSIGADMDSNGLSRWAKYMICAGAESAQDDSPRDRSAPIVQSYIDDPSPLGASAREGADARRRGGEPSSASALRRAAGPALARLVEGTTGPAPEMPDMAHYRRLAESAASEFAGLCRASARVGRLARLATSCVLARTPGDQARLPALYREASKGGLLAGVKRRRAAAEIRAIVSIGPVDPDQATEESERGAEFWAAWTEAESAAVKLGIGSSGDALESRESLASHLGALLRSLDEAMEKSPLAGWAKRLHVAGASVTSAAAVVPAPADGPGATAAPPLDGLPRELCGELAIVEPGADDPAAAAAAEAGRYATALARDSIGPVRRGIKFWSAYSALRGRIGASPGGESKSPEEALEEVQRAMDASLRRVEQSPVSEWAKTLATSRSLRGDAASSSVSGRRADAEKVARLYLADPGLLDAERRAGGGGRAEEPAAALVRAMFKELDKKGTMPDLPDLPDAAAAAQYEAMIADALSSPRGGRALAKWVVMIMGCALAGGPGRPPDPRSIPAERAASPGFLELEEGDPLSLMAAGMREAAERAAAGGLPAVEEGIRVWDAFERIGGFFGPGARAGPSAARAAPGDIESFAVDAMPTLEADALDDIQELDKKKLEYEPSIFALLEMARAEIGRGEDWTAAVRREIYAHWLDSIERAHPILAGQPLANYNSHADGLAALAESKRGLVAREISRRIESARPVDIYGKSRTLFVPGDHRAWRAMLGELKKKRRVMPVRRLIERYSDQLFRIAPCWLASPESISKALPLSRGLFDLAIVDEASQLAMERTIPFLYRAKRGVIAGDENQLPPFDLFQARAGGGEEEYDEAAETERQYDEKSLLDLARVKHTAVNLAWHYRSRHQGLIDFSNHAFYGGSLNVVPDARYDPARPPIRWVDCDGVWDDHVNEKEAAEAVRQVRMAWADAAASGRDPPTVGVITFNEAQQNLILDKIGDARAAGGEFGRLYDLAHEGGKRDAGLFVKNIENVQGDERDVIIFSIGYARDADGRFSNRFGPLNSKGGENRLNVAVTRARESMVVVSSIDPSMISESSANDGPRRFRQFLEYARAASRMDAGGQADVLARLDDASGAGGRARARAAARAGAGPGSSGDVLGSRIQKALVGAGYRVETGLGFSGYRIDLAVVDPRDENRYAVGIEYDGPTFRSAKSVMERDVMRPGLLRSKGWVFERTWSRSWWKNPESELSRLRARITEAMMR